MIGDCMINLHFHLYQIFPEMNVWGLLVCYTISKILQTSLFQSLYDWIPCMTSLYVLYRKYPRSNTSLTIQLLIYCCSIFTVCLGSTVRRRRDPARSGRITWIYNIIGYTVGLYLVYIWKMVGHKSGTIQGYGQGAVIDMY